VLLTAYPTRKLEKFEHEAGISTPNNYLLPKYNIRRLVRKPPENMAFAIAAPETPQ
jgi:hypothetical protein